ncbi:MAG: SufS family cysteine desulfurase [Rikenellaceae bacterium]
MKRRVQSAREDFPIITTTKVYGKPLCYLDSAATAQKPRRVISSVEMLHSTLNANIHRGVHYLAEQTTELYEGARERVRNFIGADSVREVIFTSGATAGLNLVAQSVCEMVLRGGDNVVVSQMEHHSNIVPWQLSAARCGAELHSIEVTSEGLLGDYSKVINERTKVVAITQASNVLGTKPELKSLIEKAHSVGALVVVDGCQGVVHGGVNVKELGCDFYAFSGHKLYAPTGIGVLWGREELLEKMPPYMGGGDMISSVSLTNGSTWAQLPLKFEAGTQNYIGAIALGEAIEYLGEFEQSEIEHYEMGLYREFVVELKKNIEGVTIFGDVEHKAPVCSFEIEGVASFDLASIVDKLGVAMRSGQLCAEPLLERCGVRTLCRASWGIYNNAQDNAQAIEAIQKAVKMLRR